MVHGFQVEGLTRLLPAGRHPAQHCCVCTALTQLALLLLLARRHAAAISLISPVKPSQGTLRRVSCPMADTRGLRPPGASTDL